MQHILRHIALLLNGLETEIALRQEYFQEHTDAWQKSEQGRAYQEKTELLNQIHTKLSDWSDELIFS